MGRSNRDKTAETRSRIIESAYTLFLEQGFNGTSVRDIGRRAEVTVGAIYNHFENKEDIWKEIILAKHPYREILPVILSAEGDSIAAVVRSSARLLVHELLKRPDLFNLMFIEIVEFKARHMQLLVETILPALGELSRIFEGKRGRLREISPVILMRSFGGLFFSYYITGILMNGNSGVVIDEDSLDRFVDLYLYGILETSQPGENSK